MHPLLKRILLNGALTAAILAGVGMLFAHFAGVMAPGPGIRPGSEDLNRPVADSIRASVPLTMAFWGFVFVAVCEAVRWRLVGGKPAAPKLPAQQPDDVEKLLNELLEQAESKRAVEAASEEQGAGSEERAEVQGGAGS
jgi:hypothetical protein